MAKKPENLQGAAASRKAHARNVALAKAFLCAIAVCAAFALGFLARGNAPLMESLGFLSPSGEQGPSASSSQAADTYTSLGARVSEVEQMVGEDSLDSFDLDQATSSVLDAFAASTKDSYLRYYDAARFAALSKDSANQYGGIGVLFSEYNGRAYAVDVFEGSGAQLANVQVNDFVVAIDGDRSHDWTQTEVAAALKREEGSDVVITWRRPATLEDAGGREFTTTLAVSNSTVKNVTAELHDAVGYIQLRQVSQNASDLVKAALSDLDGQGAQAFVLDIRDNPGGYLTQAVDTASLFVRSGALVRIQTTEPQESTKNATGTVATDKPLVVLVNGNTAASAEVLAAALQDNQRATLVGATTLGKGSVQVTRDLSFGGALRYTAAYYLSPLGHAIDGVGVVPDVQVGAADDDDNQKALALETAQSLVKE